MLPFCQQCSFLIVLHFYATGSSGATGHQNTFCTLPRDAQHVAASGKPGKDQRKGGGRERGGSHQPQSPCCALPNRGRPRLPSPLPSEERRCPCTTRAPPPRQTPPPARHGPAPSPSPALRLCGLKGRDLARSAPPRGSSLWPSMEGESTSAVLSGFVLGALSFQHLNTDSDSVS